MVERIPAADIRCVRRSKPHQIEAALFALRSPLSKGVVLAGEVGLGKTIEAGLVMCQSWAERKREILVVGPATHNMRGNVWPSFECVITLEVLIGL